MNKEKELEIVRENNMMKWKLEVATFIAENKEFIFSSNKKDRIRIRDVMIVTFPKDIVEATFQDLSATAPRSDVDTWNEGIELINKLNPKYIVIHTAAAIDRNIDVKKIDAWHKARGWSEIGHHFVIIDDQHDNLPDGTIQEGRSLSKIGAHTRGLNKMSIGIVMVGHGDKRELTDKQLESLLQLLQSLLRQYPEIKIDNVIGHSELDHLINKGVLDESYLTRTTCPGRKVNMEEIRDKLRMRISDLRSQKRVN